MIQQGMKNLPIAAGVLGGPCCLGLESGFSVPVECQQGEEG